MDFDPCMFFFLIGSIKYIQGFACFDKIVWFGYLHPQSEGLFFWFGRVDYRLFHWNGSQHNCIA